MSEIDNRGNQLRLVPANTPEGLIVHTQFGVSKKTTGPSLSRFQKDELGPVKNLRPILASEVGLEWIDTGDTKISSDRWAKEFYVLVSDEN